MSHLPAYAPSQCCLIDPFFRLATLCDHFFQFFGLKSLKTIYNACFGLKIGQIGSLRWHALVYETARTFWRQKSALWTRLNFGECTIASVSYTGACTTMRARGHTVVWYMFQYFAHSFCFWDLNRSIFPSCFPSGVLSAHLFNSF